MDLLTTFKAPYFLLFLLLLSCGRKGEDSVYIIPEKYEGNLIVLFDEPDGLDTAYENQARLYLFDTTGVLKTKFSPNFGIQQNRYYYVDRFGHRTDIKYALPSQLKGTDEVVIVNQETGNHFDTLKKEERHFEILTVAKPKNVDSIANLRSDFMWKLLK